MENGKLHKTLVLYDTMPVEQDICRDFIPTCHKLLNAYDSTFAMKNVTPHVTHASKKFWNQRIHISPNKGLVYDVLGELAASEEK